MTSQFVRARRSKTGELIAYSDLAIKNNAAVVEYCKISTAALSGITAGALGFTGLLGFVFYFFGAFCLWVGKNHPSYIKNRRSLLTNGLLGGLLYVLFWTFLYGMVHVY